MIPNPIWTSYFYFWIWKNLCFGFLISWGPLNCYGLISEHLCVDGNEQLFNHLNFSFFFDNRFTLYYWAVSLILD